MSRQHNHISHRHEDKKQSDCSGQRAAPADVEKALTAQLKQHIHIHLFLLQQPQKRLDIPWCHPVTEGKATGKLAICDPRTLET